MTGSVNTAARELLFVNKRLLLCVKPSKKYQIAIFLRIIRENLEKEGTIAIKMGLKRFGRGKKLLGESFKVKISGNIGIQFKDIAPKKK